MWSQLMLIGSVLLNLFCLWYIINLLRKLWYVSENLGDIFLVFKSFGVFVRSLHSMDSYHGEPVIQDLIRKTQEVLEEMEEFREIFEITLDQELEEELNDAADEIWRQEAP